MHPATIVHKQVKIVKLNPLMTRQSVALRHKRVRKTENPKTFQIPKLLPFLERLSAPDSDDSANVVIIALRVSRPGEQKKLCKKIMIGREGAEKYEELD